MDPNVDIESSILFQAPPIFYNNIIHQETRIDTFLDPFLQIKEKDVQDQQTLFITDSSIKLRSLEVESNVETNQNDTSQLNNDNTTNSTKVSVGETIVKTQLFNTKQYYTNKENVAKIQKSLKINQTYVHISDRVVPPRALAVLPPALQLKGNVVSPRRVLPPRVRFGPVQGVKHNLPYSKTNELILMAAVNKTPLFLLKTDDGFITYIDASDKDKSNWFCLLNLGDAETSNVWIYEENNELYGITTKIIPSRKPLMLGYSKTYVETFNLPLEQPVLNLTESLVDAQNWWCYECRRSMVSALALERHINSHHKNNFIISRKRHRCKNCNRTFSRLYTLKRHMRRFCINKGENNSNKTPKETVGNVSLNTSQSTDDNRIPSDESFQNYSNGLDFSTNLFDDRMPSLDITTNSRSECDFSLYDTVLREDNVLPTDIGFNTNALDCSENDQIDKQHDALEQVLTSCSCCNQVVTRKTKSKHISECPGRRYECKCSRVFKKKEALAEHIKTVHIDDVNSKETKIPESAYNCEKCQLNFKRRGMLVNHLWRVHKTKSVSVPLEKHVRLYPCVACHRIYHSAAKRDNHVRVHHPGAEEIRAQSIEGALRAYEPAACVACPRQYATRAKMLQHLRKQHPDLAPPIWKGSHKSKS